jgi:DNA (cytosine-5)-methyltransferase 1
MADRYRQIGNAVPVGLGKAIGESILATMLGVSQTAVRQGRLFEFELAGKPSP